ncbi:putative cysteine-rich receptor-like protein kinase 20 [Phoenix dactylifera]|uniref:Cysteine-rich receptor-like protein kinase 20 n=1 Tax=Phoenix dactylifera TaxID=42345 RepID=A0A8B9A734_PHODC|nr:putative cysteine-rich receptor-like protein kinase 20 [Phoenix dactylifera]
MRLVLLLTPGCFPSTSWSKGVTDPHFPLPSLLCYTFISSHCHPGDRRLEEKKQRRRERERGRESYQQLSSSISSQPPLFLSTNYTRGMDQTSRWMLILCNQREAFSFLLFLATSHVLFHSSFGATKSTPTFKPIKLDCSDDSFIQDDTTRTSLEALFSSLRSKALRSNSGSGAIGSGPGAIYGSFLCQSDLSYEDCRTCIHMAAANLLQSCSSSSSSASSRRGAIWINCCQLHYSDRNIHGVAGINGFNLASLHEETNSMKPSSSISH